MGMPRGKGRSSHVHITTQIGDVCNTQLGCAYTTSKQEKAILLQTHDSRYKSELYHNTVPKHGNQGLMWLSWVILRTEWFQELLGSCSNFGAFQSDGIRRFILKPHRRKKTFKKPSETNKKPLNPPPLCQSNLNFATLCNSGVALHQERHFRDSHVFLQNGCGFFAYSRKLPAYSGAFLLTVDHF